MFRKAISVVVAVSGLLLGGCATPTKMAFSDGAESVIKADKSVYLMSATLRNTYKPSHQPKLLVANVERNAGKSKEDKINFKMDGKGKSESDWITGSTYLLRLELENGEYVLRGLTSMSSSFPVHGFFFAPIHASIVAKTPGIYYLGHVEAIVRERVGDEFKAGPVIPLIDQAVAGASGGTFDIEISDQWAQDEAKFKEQFPVLTKADIQKAILPAFDRQVAQKWWQAN